MRARASAVAAAALAAFVVAGCETSPETRPVADPERAFAERQVRIAALDEWTALGKLAVRAPDDAWTVNVRWHQAGERYAIRLSGPLGQGIMELDGTRAGVELRTADNDVLRAASADELLLEQTGWRLPVSGLRFWILGSPAPGVPVESMALDAGGRLERLRQGGWDIHFERYDEFQQLALPTRLSLESGRIGARMVVRGWTLGPES